MHGDLLPCCTYRYEKEVLNCSLPATPQVSQNASGLREVHVAYSSDSQNFAGLLSSMISVSLHAREPGLCTIHIVVSKEDAERAEELVKCFRHEVAVLPAVPEVVLHHLVPANVSALKTTYRRHLLKPQTFARLRLHEYLPNSVPRVVWFDHDTIVRSDVGALYRTDMSHAIAATWDHGHGNTARGSRLRSYLPHLSSVARASIHDMDARVFCTGIMVIDLAAWRAGGTAQAVETLVRALDGVEGEQLAMNVHFRDKIDVLDWRWNVMGLGWLRYRLPDRCIQEAHVLHWSGPNRHKPWHQSWSRVRIHDDLYRPYTPKRQLCAAIL